MIQWFPGHMKKAIREIDAMSRIADLFIIILDSRAPISSYNFEFDSISPQKPRLFVFTKKDLADHIKISKIINRFKEKHPHAIFVNLQKQSDIKLILKKIEILLKKKRIRDEKKGLLKSRLRAIVMGIPNAGKSTLINSLARKKMARVGNKPGVTRGQQWISLKQIQLLDTPGILWPKFENESIAIKLAMIGSIKYEILNKEEFIFKSIILLSKKYPTKLKPLGIQPIKLIEEAHQQVIDFANRKKFLTQNKEINWNKTIDYIATYIKNLKDVTYD